jgi:hypothetical protein
VLKKNVGILENKREEEAEKDGRVVTVCGRAEEGDMVPRV